MENQSQTSNADHHEAFRHRRRSELGIVRSEAQRWSRRPGEQCARYMDCIECAKTRWKRLGRARKYRTIQPHCVNAGQHSQGRGPPTGQLAVGQSSVEPKAIQGAQALDARDFARDGLRSP